MIKNWPELKSAKGNQVRQELSDLADWLEENRGTLVGVKIYRFNHVLKGALLRHGGNYSELTNGERKEEFRKLANIAQSIFDYFYSSEYRYLIWPAVYEENKVFWSYRNRFPNDVRR